jgi:hypothetical protein
MTRPNAIVSVWLGVGSVCLAAATPARGDVFEFVLDPARSRIAAAAGFNNELGGADEGVPQRSGYDAASFTGVLRVEVDADSIRFLEGSFADAMLNPIAAMPNPGGAGPAPADYAWAATPAGTAARAAALRDLRFDLFSNDIELPGRPDGGFRDSVFARVGSGRADSTLGDDVLSFDFAGPDRIPGDDDPLGYLTSDGVTQTVTFPFYTTLVSRFPAGDGSGDYYMFHGNVTATRPVPEPEAALAALALPAALLARRRRRWR